MTHKGIFITVITPKDSDNVNAGWDTTYAILKSNSICYHIPANDYKHSAKRSNLIASKLLGKEIIFHNNGIIITKSWKNKKIAIKALIVNVLERLVVKHKTLCTLLDEE